ncbi:hypothetical protein [Kitasatospora sp. NPDC050543]|uniref:hypothetical protein n=1 Tax=Kitasatospora sp. NPDC050543 TaxID=3364054 RepID=UPI0037AA36F6
MSVAADGGGGTPPSASSDPIGWAVAGMGAASLASAGVAAAAGAASLVAAYGAKTVQVELDTLIGFKKKIDGLLHDLEASPAAQAKISEQQLSDGNLGSGFSESADLMAAYNRTHGNLDQLAKALATQIEAMGSAIAAAAANYGGTEDAQTSNIKGVDGKVVGYSGPVPNVPAVAGQSAGAAGAAAAPPSTTVDAGGAGAY